MDSSPRRSILAEMALRFVDQRETLATAGLGHVLSSSATARAALASWLAERGAAIPGGLGYRIEVVDPEQEGRPDVVGLLGESRHLILEGKFWASLTDSQPVGYLKSLSHGGCLLVVAPSLRFETVGAELVRRCVVAGLPVHDGPSVISGGLSQVASRWWLGVISWRTLLGRLQEKLADACESALAGDVEQLVSLSDLEDQDAFLPLDSSDLSTPTPQRVYQYMQLVDAVCARGVEVGLLQRHNFRPAGPMGKYIRYIAAGHIQLAIFVDLYRWSRQRLTPLWVELAVAPGEALAGLEAEMPARVFYDGVKGRPVVPLMLPLHVEQAEVVRQLVAQLVELVALAMDCAPTVQVALPPAV